MGVFRTLTLKMNKKCFNVVSNDLQQRNIKWPTLPFGDKKKRHFKVKKLNINLGKISIHYVVV